MAESAKARASGKAATEAADKAQVEGWHGGVRWETVGPVHKLHADSVKRLYFQASVGRAVGLGCHPFESVEPFEICLSAFALYEMINPFSLGPTAI
jgi:hypothetical protein